MSTVRLNIKVNERLVCARTRVHRVRRRDDSARELTFSARERRRRRDRCDTCY